MPKAVDGLPKAVVNNITATFERVLSINNQTMLGAAKASFDRAEILFSNKYAGNPSYDSKIVSYLQRLEDAARRQTQGTCAAANDYMSRQGYGRADKAYALLHSTHIGHQFGRLGRLLRENEMVVLAEMTDSPQAWFVPGVIPGEIDFSELGKQRLRQFYAPTIGCPVLTIMVEYQGHKRSLYDAYWSMFSAQYVQFELLPDIKAAPITQSAPNLQAS